MNTHPAPLPLAQVQTPTGSIWYIPRAQRHGDFVVQRRYQEVGKPSYSINKEKQQIWESALQLEAYLIPFLNPGAVRAAGLDMATIMAWNASHPGQIFTHPTYAPLCLRWGNNPYQYVVTEQVQEPATESAAIFFTPHTCWVTGITYYELDVMADGQITNMLSAQAGLLQHGQEIGLEGSWLGHYVTDLEDTRRVLREHGYQMVIASAHLFYGVCVYPDSTCPEHWLGFYETAEAALTYYQQLVESDPTGKKYNSLPIAMWGGGVQWPGKEIEWRMFSEKTLPPEFVARLLQEPSIAPASAPIQPTRMSRYEVGEAEWPLLRRIPTLTDKLNSVSFSRKYLADVLGCSLEVLQQRERKPWQLTLFEARQLAKAAGLDERDLLLGLQEELAAWEEEWDRQKKEELAMKKYAQLGQLTSQE
jgi:hypothetical protein